MSGINKNMLSFLTPRHFSRLLIKKLSKCLLLTASCSNESSVAVTTPTLDKKNEKNTKKVDKLFRSVELEVRGHDKAVLNSYTLFVKNACVKLQIDSSPVVRLPYVKWIQYALRAKFAKKKYKLHYETRTHISRMSVFNVTGSTASTFLEYVERNIPEGVGMKVTYEEICFLPDTIKLKLN